MGKRNRSLGVVISTQAADDFHPLSELIDDAQASPDRSVVMHLRTAPVDADPFDHDVIRSVNPALGIFLDEAVYLLRRERRGGCQRKKARFAICGSISGFRHIARAQLFTPEQWALGDGAVMPHCSPMAAKFMAASTCRRAPT